MADYQHGVPININDTFRVDGVETDPTAIVYTILGPDGTTDVYNWPGAPEITHVGVGVFSLSLSPPTLPGFYSYDVDATGAVVASRTGSFNILPNVATDVDIPWAVTGPCTPWTSSQAAWTCCGQPTEVVGNDECPVDFASHVAAASEVLFELSGRLYSGACEKTVRPCATDYPCGFQVLSRGHIVTPWDVHWNGLAWGPDSYACGCQPLSQILLSGYPVREITEVKIDGEELRNINVKRPKRLAVTSAP